jgi:predicted porin
MKKTLIALATLGVVGAASAQVSISGSMAVGIQTTTSNSAAKFHLTDGDINFSGSEDLGGGLSVSASTSISTEAGRSAGTTNNNVAMSISGGFGKLAYQRILSGKAKMGDISVEDDITVIAGGYTKPSIFNYTSPELLAGTTATLEWAEGTDNTDITVGGAPNVIINWAGSGATVYAATGGASKNWDLRATYDAGMAKIVGRTTKTKITEFGFDVPNGAMTFNLRSYNDKTNTRKASGFGMTYAMSKQTSILSSCS